MIVKTRQDLVYSLAGAGTISYVVKLLILVVADIQAPTKGSLRSEAWILALQM